MNSSPNTGSADAKSEGSSKANWIQFCESHLGFVGYALDLFRVATLSFNAAHSYTKFLVINRVRKLTGATTFVETGTFLGDTTNRTSGVFEKVFTIELGHDLATRAKNRFRNKSHVMVIEGDATEKLHEVFEKHDFNKSIVFLDGHFSEGITACGDLPEPAILELEYLAKHKKRILGIVIDDFRTFGVLEGFPSKAQLLASAECLFGPDGYEVSVLMDQVIIYKKA